MSDLRDIPRPIDERPGGLDQWWLPLLIVLTATFAAGYALAQQRWVALGLALTALFALVPDVARAHRRWWR